MEAFRENTLTKFETENDSVAVDKLIDEFPDELHDGLLDEIDGFDDRTARDYLVSKLIDRKMALLPAEYREIPKAMEVINDNPLAVQESLERAHESESEFLLGAGHNAEVVSSTRQENMCYKTLFMERAKSLGANISREALLQHAVHELIAQSKYSGLVPKVEGFVRTPDIQAIKMEKIDGFSLRQLFDNPESVSLPEDFDVDLFFETLTGLVECINNAGYFHRDLLGNAGNVLCTTKGLPVLIDFGSAVKAIDYDPEQIGYQIVPGGQFYVSNDIAAVRDLKTKLVAFLQKRAE